MKNAIIALVMISALSVCPVISYGGDQSVYSPWSGEYKSAKSDRTFEDQATKIIGITVVNRQGDFLGKVVDLMIDSQEGRIAFAVLSRGGILGIPTRFVAVPFGALTPVNEKNLYLLDVSKEKIAAAPSFNRDHWPDVSDRQWAGNHYRYFGQNPYWEESSEDCRK